MNFDAKLEAEIDWFELTRLHQNPGMVVVAAEYIPEQMLGLSLGIN